VLVSSSDLYLHSLDPATGSRNGAQPRRSRTPRRRAISADMAAGGADYQSSPAVAAARCSSVRPTTSSTRRCLVGQGDLAVRDLGQVSGTRSTQRHGLLRATGWEQGLLRRGRGTDAPLEATARLGVGRGGFSDAISTGTVEARSISPRARRRIVWTHSTNGGVYPAPAMDDSNVHRLVGRPLSSRSTGVPAAYDGPTIWAGRPIPPRPCCGRAWR
jgi:hypothetical protein